MSKREGKEPRCFAVCLQWLPGDLFVQEDGLTWDEAYDAIAAYRLSARPPYRCAMALVVVR